MSVTWRHRTEVLAENMFSTEAYDRVWAYCQDHTTPPDPILHALERYTHLHTLNPQMLSGPLQGRLLTLLSQLLAPKRILEVGTFTGYSGLCLAKGLSEGGVLHTIEANDELVGMIQAFAQQAGLSRQIVLHIGDAAEIIPSLEETFDLIFLDGGKLDYLTHYELALPKLRAGGLLLADNVLWSGKVVLDAEDETAKALRAFNARVHADERVENVLLPLCDGLMLVRKKPSQPYP